MSAHADGPSDPTRSGSPVPAGAGALLSRNEVEMLCLKAARGAGMSWGLAEEAGFAAGWLAARGLDGAGPMLARLRRADDGTMSQGNLSMSPVGWASDDKTVLCPIAVGAALCDFANLPETTMADGPLKIAPVCHPVLLLPFLPILAACRSGAVALAASGCTVVVTGLGQLTGDVAGLADIAVADVDLSPSPAAAPAPATRFQPASVPQDVSRGLDGFAMRTTVPASVASRAGAGAATSDND